MADVKSRPTRRRPSDQRTSVDPVEDAGRAARQRLRQARKAANLTPELLAAKIGRSSSSVRAHENGQNQISAAAADLYAAALGVSAAWLLFGVDDDAIAKQFEPPDGNLIVSIIGEIRGDNPNQIFEDGTLPHLELHLPDFKDVPLVGFLVGQPAGTYRRGDYVVVAPIDVGLRAGDHLVIGTRRGAEVFYALFIVELNSSGLHLRPLSKVGGRLGLRELPEGVHRPHQKGEARVEGVVVAYGGQDRPASGPVIRPDRLKGISWLT